MENKLKEYCLIVNPAAGKRCVDEKWDTIRSLLEEHNFEYEAFFTKAKGDAIQLTKAAIKKGYRKIIGVGGDGTNNEIINGILEQKMIPTQDIQYTLLPFGTGNDWIKTHKIPKSIAEWIPQIKNGKVVQQDIGLVNYHENNQAKSRYFCNVAGLAYDGFIAMVSEKYKKRISNKIFYLFLIFRCLFQYSLKRARISFNNEVIEDYFYTINAGICRYSGGGMQIVPHAKPNDGLFALTLATSMSKFDVIKATPLFYNGKVGTHPKVTTSQTNKIKIESLEEEETLLEVDGEFLGETPVEFSIIRNALTVIVPNL